MHNNHCQVINFQCVIITIFFYSLIIIIGDGGCTSAEISGEEGFHSCEAGGHQGPGGAR